LSGIAVNYRHSPIVEEHAAEMAGPFAGDRAPDAPLVKANGGGSLRLYDLFAEHRHTLLLLGNAGRWQPPLPNLSDRQLVVHRVAAAGSSGGQLIDRDEEVAKRYGSASAAYLIRPDGYVGFRCGESELSAHLPRYLAKLFGSGYAPNLS
jgi:hypothetical protein